MTGNATAITTRLPTYIPKAETRVPVLRADSPPPRPSEVSPIFDHENSTKPIESWSEELALELYPDKASEGDASPIPPSPNRLDNPYLLPILARNERLRLTMLWYHTRDLTDDKDLLMRLDEKVRLIREIIGWEFALTGLLDNDVYTRVAAAGLPLAILPRRESTCAHTINQQSTFMLPNMKDDWRFRESPHVEYGGLRAYAGSPLQIVTEFGEKIAFGSLCVASNTPQPPLSSMKQAALASFADMIAAEIVHASKLRRQSDRHLMSELIQRLQVRIHSTYATDTIVDLLKEKYSDTTISLQTSKAETIQLEGREPIAYSDVADGIWEDTDFLEAVIMTSNHEDLVSTQTVRAIVRKCAYFATPTFIVVASKNCKEIFDDVDSWFVDRCALILSNAQQEQDLKKALKAKDTFLRGITHQLRTPIHGVLGSVELLAEELKSRDLLGDDKVSASQENPTSFNAAPFVRTIKTSGRHLMSIVDSMLKLNRWDDMTIKPRAVTLSELKDLETEILKDVVQTIPEEDLVGTSVFFHNKLPQESAVVAIDLTVLKDCLLHLITNALQNTPYGTVTVTLSAIEDNQALQIDVKDTGRGIAQEDHARIFDAYEKCDPHSRGVGLGLTLAAKLAYLMNGTVNLVNSQLDKGSHFQIVFQCPIVATTVEAPPSGTETAKPVSLPLSFFRVPPKTDGQLGNLFEEYLLMKQLKPSPSSSLLIVDYTSDAVQFQERLGVSTEGQTIVCLVPCGAQFKHLQRCTEHRKINFICGPFTSNLLDTTLREIHISISSRSSSLGGLFLPVNQQKDCQEVVLTTPACPLISPMIPTRYHSTSGVPTTVQVKFEATVEIRPLSSPQSSYSSNTTDNVHVNTSPEPVALLVDDNKINLQIMQMYCKKRKIPYITATDGVEAVEAFLEGCLPQPHGGKRVNLVLMDLQMPNRDGCEATTDIRRLEKERGWSRCAILMVTGQDSPKDRSRSTQAGADGYFVKPVAMKALDMGIQEFFPTWTMR